MLMQHYMKKNMATKSSSVNKGVGGYRPTIDWHEITIKRKNVADRQVLACIVISGLIIIVVGVVITLLGFFVIENQCPLEWEKGSGTCYYFAEHNASWDDSRGYCDSQGANLLDLHTDAEADFIKERMLGVSWLGLYRQKDAEQWAWLSGAKVNYTVWENTPAIAATEKECVVMEETGLWNTISCDGDSAFVICDYIPGYNPFVLIGPVVIFCGVVVLMLSIEVCVRRKEFKEKNPEIMEDDDDDDERQETSGVVNPGFSDSPRASQVAPA